MSEQQIKRGPGRPRTGKKPRIDTTLSQDVLDFIDWLIGKEGNMSKFLEEQIKAHPRYQEWQHGRQSKDGSTGKERAD
jgi:hypothetical protein